MEESPNAIILSAPFSSVQDEDVESADFSMEGTVAPVCVAAKQGFAKATNPVQNNAMPRIAFVDKTDGRRVRLFFTTL